MSSELKEVLVQWDESTGFSEILYNIICQQIVMEMHPDNFTKAQFEGFSSDIILDVLVNHLEEAGITPEEIYTLMTIQKRMMEVTDRQEVSEEVISKVEDFVYQNVSEEDRNKKVEVEEVLEA